MNLIPLLATSVESHSHSIIDALPHMTGMAVVMVALATLWGITALCARIIAILIPEAKTPSAPTKASPPVAANTPTQSTDHQIPPQIVAVISAAVASVCGNQPVRIISIKSNNTGWEQAGRRSVLSSHRIR